MLGAVILSVIAACDVSSPERFIRAPIIRSFSPESPYFEILAGDTVIFSVSAIDPDDGNLRFDFVLGDSVVSGDDTWTYVVNDTGSVEVEARVYNQASSAVVTWKLKRIRPVNEPPFVVGYQPADPNPSVRIGESIDFSMSAEDPEGRPVSYIFTVDDSLVSGGNRYTYHATAIGHYSVKSVAADGEGFAVHEWNLNVLGEPDSIHPGPVVITSLETGQETGELLVRWTAVGDDGLEGLPAAYIVRVSPVEITDEDAWIQASDRSGEPSPATPGQTQQMAVPFLPPATTVFVAVRAVDEFGNLSPLTTSLAALVKGNDVTGTVLDAESGEPIVGAIVRLAGDEALTDANGRYVLSAVPDGIDPIRIVDEDDPQDYGAYFDILTDPYMVQDEDVRDFWMIPNLPLQTTHYTSLLDFANWMTQNSGPFGDLLQTWDEPVDVYVIPFVNNGLDYGQVVTDQLLEWESLTGIDLFRMVNEIPTFGFYVTYSSVIERDFYREREEDEQKMPVLGEIVLRTFYDLDSESLLDRVAGHEIGHALGLRHSNDILHLMVGGSVPQPMQPTPDEVILVRVMYGLPRGHSMNWFLFD